MLFSGSVWIYQRLSSSALRWDDTKRPPCPDITASRIMASSAFADQGIGAWKCWGNPRTPYGNFIEQCWLMIMLGVLLGITIMDCIRKILSTSQYLKGQQRVLNTAQFATGHKNIVVRWFTYQTWSPVMFHSYVKLPFRGISIKITSHVNQYIVFGGEMGWSAWMMNSG